MKVKVWKVSTIEKEFGKFGQANYVPHQRYVEAKTEKGAVSNAKNIWCLEPAEIKSVVLVPELS